MPTAPDGAGAEPAGPHGCRAAVIIAGEHHWCDLTAPHGYWPHSSVAAQTIWRGVGPYEIHPADRTPDQVRDIDYDGYTGG